MLKKCKEHFDKMCIVTIALAVLVRVVLQMLLPIWALGDYGVDDFLMVQYANEISNTGWLGEYNAYTLNKLPGYSIFLAISNSLELPYMLSLGIFYSVACLIFLIAIRKIVKHNGISIFCFLFLLYSPIMFDNNIAQRIYRLAICPALVIMIVSAYIAIYAEREKGIKKNLLWMVLAAISYASICLVREDVTWLTCFIIGATIVLAILYLIENRKNIKAIVCIKFVLFLILPFLIEIVGSNILCIVNYNKYGVYATTDFNETYFSKVCKLLMEIEPEEEIACIYISRNTWDRAVEASPTLASLFEEEMNERYESPQAIGKLGDEFYKAMFVWNFRWAADNVGIYEDAVETNNYFKQVYEELQEAFQCGKFEKRSALVFSPYARPIRQDDMEGIVKYSFRGYRDIISYADIETEVNFATGTNENLSVMEDVVNELVLISNEKYLFKGWIFSTNDEKSVFVQIYDSDGNVFEPIFRTSEDVYEHYATIGCNYKNAYNCRFSTEINAEMLDIENLYVRVSLGQDIIYDGEIENVEEIVNDEIRLYLDENRLEETNCLYPSAEKVIITLNRFIKVYRYTWWIVTGFAFFVYILEFVVNIVKFRKKRKTNISAWVIKTGMLLTIWANLLIISVNYFETDAENFKEHYAAGVYPIWQIFVCLTLCTFVGYVQVIWDRYKMKRMDIDKKEQKEKS